MPLAAYVAQMKALAANRGYLDHERLKSGFQHLIVDDAMLEKLGPAVNAGKAVFLYGPPGNGKTVLAEGMGAVDRRRHVHPARDRRGRPHHHDVRPDLPRGARQRDGGRDEGSVIRSAPRDRRWVRIRRPVVMVGGELTLDMLDLTFNPISKFYEAPIQLKANGGVFLVDDFGRQRIRPQELLNRWIVPLESRFDYLTLHTGKKFQLPFDVLIVFATNLNPASLADEAFLRRIPYKIPVDDPTMEQFVKIFELNCQRRNLRFHQVMVAYLQRRHYGPPGPSAAVVPSARPARSGHRALPLSRHRAGDHARAARCGVRVVFRRRTGRGGHVRSASSGADSGRGPQSVEEPAGDSLMDGLAPQQHRSAGAGDGRRPFHAAVDQHPAGLPAHGPRDRPAAPRERGPRVVLTIIRRPAQFVDRSMRAAMVTAISVIGPPLLMPSMHGRPRPRPRHRHRPRRSGSAWWSSGKLTLGRSFGLVPANRGVVIRGPYALVRHPIYSGYLITHLAFLVAHPTLVERRRARDRRHRARRRARSSRSGCSIGDAEYQAYCERVGWHLVPGVF